MLKKNHRLNPQAPIAGLFLKLGTKFVLHLLQKKWNGCRAKRLAEEAQKHGRNWPPSAASPMPA